MRIALVYPATTFDHRDCPEALPIGILYLAAVTETRQGATVDIYDSRHTSACPEASNVNDYDVIGFTAMTPQISVALHLARRVRKAGYRGSVVFGGPHASVASDHLRSQGVADAVLVGEAEETFPQYLSYLEGKRAGLQRAWIRDSKGDWRFHSGDGFVENLDALPFPAREKYGDLTARTRQINMTTTRGCPYQCRFCQPSKRILFGARVRRRSIENILAEIEDSVKRYGIEHVCLDDDTFTFHENAVLEFCEAIGPLRLQWSCQSRSDIRRETLQAMRDSGCDSLAVGVESGSQRVLDLMGKKNTVEKNEEFIRNCNELGIRTFCNMMVGYPGETPRDMEQSLAFVRKTRPSRVCVSQATPFPGTYLWEQNREDLIEHDWRKVARHAYWPKFKSMRPYQHLLHYYQYAMGKDWDEPLGADIIAHCGPLTRWVFRSRTVLPLVMRYLSFLLPALTRKGRRYLGALDTAVNLARSGNIEESVARLESLKRGFPRETGPLGHLGWIYLTTGRPEKAIENYGRLLALDPDNVEARDLLAKARSEADGARGISVSQ